jgi:spore maturation protein CgeB
VRVLVVDTYYDAFLERHYEERAGLAAQSYAEQFRALMDRRFGTSDAWSHALGAAGHEARTVVANCVPLQACWADEDGAARLPRLRTRLPGRLGIAAGERLPQEIAFAQARGFDVVLCQDMGFFERRDLDRLRANGALVAGQIASPAPDRERLGGYDVIFTSFPHFVDRFRADGLDAEYLPLAFDERLLDVLPASDRSRAVTFVGGVHPRVHAAGTALLEQLAERVPLEVWGYGADELAPESPLRKAHRGEAWGLDMYRLLAESRIVVNRHIDVAEGHANNMRLYEATGAGALLITEAADNLHELFQRGREVVTYADADQLVEQIEHYLRHDDERQAIAAAGRRRTLTEHTYTRRAERLAALLELRLRSARRP